MFEKEAEEYFRDNAHNFDEVTACRECMEFGFNKANEWHYVKDGDFPKQFGYYLVALKSIAYKGFVCEVVYFTGSIFTKEGEISDNVYAWKEIVPPELKESE